MDFLSARLEIERRKGYPDWEKNIPILYNVAAKLDSMHSRLLMWFSIRARQTISFSHYAISLVILFGWVILDVAKF